MKDLLNFLLHCEKTLGKDSLLWKKGYSSMYHYPSEKDKKTNKDPDAPYLSVYWKTGGMSGGSCWDTGEPKLYAERGDPPEELKELDTLLESIRPEISFLQYKLLTSSLVDVEYWTQDEYYGNSTSYMSKALSLPKLHAYMLEKGWLE